MKLNLKLSNQDCIGKNIVCIKRDIYIDENDNVLFNDGEILSIVSYDESLETVTLLNPQNEDECKQFTIPFSDYLLFFTNSWKNTNDLKDIVMFYNDFN